jgi:hypothetical protein
MPGITSTRHGKARKPTTLTTITCNAWSVLFTMVLFLRGAFCQRIYRRKLDGVDQCLIPLKVHPS